ncbi:MAG: MipA/OmpV family protein [Pontiellaceae bacterium]|nr:MipA/OmpV family protein [Pontiellaceae bacterium]MBN2784664.1 MipA/OmpV family protein [Pontiellaceae bacterium]
MKQITATLLFLMTALAAGQAAQIRVHLNHPPAEGRVVFVLYDSANTFGDLRDPALTVSEPLDGRDEYIITNVPPAEYALLVFHDENGNRAIDKNFVGIPREPLGFSNNYTPKGPPSYARAAFVLSDQAEQSFDVALYRPLGERGRIGIGPGLIMQSSPYRDYDGGVYRFIPAITYTGSRLQWFGPQVQFGLAGSRRLRLAATGTYRIGPYEESGSPALAGMGDAEDTVMAGLALQAELPGGMDLSMGAAGDLIDRIGGFEADIRLGKAWQAGIVRISPGIALNWMDSGMARNDFGVSPAQAAIGRPAYDPGDTFGLEAGCGLFAEITEHWMLVGQLGIEWLDHAATDSPIVDADYLYKGYMALNYLF